MRRVGFGDLLERQHVGQGIHACAAVFFGDFDPHESHLAHLLDGVVGKFPAFVKLGRDGRDLFLRKIAGGVTDHFMFIVQWKKGGVTHGCSSEFGLMA